MPIRAFSREKFEEERFDKANTDLMKTQLFTNRTMVAMMPFMTLIMNGTSLLIVWFGGKAMDLGNMQVGEMIAFITYTMQIVMSFLMLSMVAVMLPRAGVARPHRRGHQDPLLPSTTLPRRKPCPRAAPRALWPLTMSASTIPALTRTRWSISALPPNPGRRRPSSAPQAAANRRCSTSSRVLRRQRRQCDDRRRRCARYEPGAAARPTGLRAAERRAVQRHH